MGGLPRNLKRGNSVQPNLNAGPGLIRTGDDECIRKADASCTTVRKSLFLPMPLIVCGSLQNAW